MIIKGLSSAAFAACIVLGATHSAAQSYSENYLGVFGGYWLGEDFREASVDVIDSVVGPITYSSSLKQGNGVVMGLQYTGFFTPIIAADITFGYLSGTWTTEGGRLEQGALFRESMDIPGVVTLPMALNALVRVPLGDALPKPFVTGGLGAIFYEFSESNAPLRVPPTIGTPIDTVLFDLKLGLRLAPNIGGGLLYSVTNRIYVRAEGRLWATIIEERVVGEKFTQKNKWLLLSAMFKL